MARTWLASGLVALLCAACDVPTHGLVVPPPEAGGSEDADVVDAYVPVTHYEAGAGSTAHTEDAGSADADAAVAKEAGIPDAPEAEASAPTDAGDESTGDDGGDDPH